MMLRSATLDIADLAAASTTIGSTASLPIS